MIHSVKVLNTVTALGTDVSVDSNGILNMAGVATTEAYNVRGVTINTPVAPVNGVITIDYSVGTTTGTYSFNINGFSKATGLPKSMIVTYTTAATTSATLQSNQIRAIVNADSDFSVAATGTATVVLTSAAGFPEFTVGGALGSVNSLTAGSAVTIFTNITAQCTTAGVIAVGTPAILREKYGYNSNTNSMTYSDMANLTTGYYYTEVIIDYLGTGYSGSSAFKGEISTNQTVIFVRQGTTAGTVTTTNYNDLLGTYGTVTGLAAGYRVTGALMTAATATSTNAAGVQTLNSGGLASVNDIVAGDYIVSVSTPIVQKVISTLTDNTYLANTTTSLTVSSTLNSFKWRALPL
jgi:hypothetical protein